MIYSIDNHKTVGGKKGKGKMNENIKKRNRLLAEKVIKGLESRNMSGYYAETKGRKHYWNGRSNDCP